LLDYAKQYGATAFHPTSTYKMGIDPMAEVGLAVHGYGMDRLRMVDASVMSAGGVEEHERGHDHDCREGGRYDPATGRGLQLRQRAATLVNPSQQTRAVNATGGSHTDPTAPLSMAMATQVVTTLRING
jgi:hypothetical protein